MDPLRSQPSDVDLNITVDVDDATDDLDRVDPAWAAEASSGDLSRKPAFSPRASAVFLEPSDSPPSLGRIVKRARASLSGDRRPSSRAVAALDAAGLFDVVELRYKEDGHWEDLVEMYLQRLESAESEQDKARLFRRIAHAFREGIGDEGQAFDALTEAFRIDPSDRDGVAALERLARKLGRFEALVAMLAPSAIEETDDGRAVAICEHAIRWCRDEATGASPEVFLARIRKVDPGHPAVHRRLASMYRENGVWDAQKESLLRALVRVRDGGERRQIHMSLARLEEERFGDQDAAAAHYDDALAIEPDDVDALAGLERIARDQKKWKKLVTVLERQAEVARGAREKAAALVRLAEVHERVHVRPHAAAPRLEEALALDGDSLLALDMLERCYHAMRDYEGLARTLARRAAVETDRRTRVDVFFRLAEVEEEKRREPDAAAAAYRAIIKLDDENHAALVALARLSERARDWRTAAVCKSRLADLAESTQASAQMHVAIGDMLAHDAGDPVRARQHYERATQTDPGNAAAWEALQRMARLAGDDRKVASCIAQRAQFAPSPRVRAQLYVELGQHQASALEDPRSASASFELAIQSDPTNEGAARALLDVYTRAQRWAELLPLLDLLLGAALRDGDTALSYELLARSTRAASACGDHDRALRAALRAFEMRARDVDAKRAVVRAAHAVAHLEGAARESLHKTLGMARDALRHISTAGELLEADDHVQLAEVEHALGDDGGAAAAYAKALTLDANHVRALAGLAHASAVKGDYGRAASFLHRRARATPDLERRFALLVEAAETWAGRARNLEKATLVFEEALALKPTDGFLLHTLLRVYGEAQSWEQLGATLRKIADLEESNERKAKIVFAMAQVVREKIGDRRRALTLLEEVLALDPTRLDAFERVVRTHTELRDWRALAHAYRAMILRVADAHVDLKHALFHQLGLVFRDRLGHRQRALQAFSAASRLKPDADEDRRIVAELLVSLNKVTLAVATTRERVATNPEQVAPYLELLDLLLRQRQFDEAWCTADVLAHLGGLDGEGAEFHAAYPAPALEDVPGTLDPSAWGSHVLHAALEPALTDVLRIVTCAMRRTRAAAFGPEDQRGLGEPLMPGLSPTADRVYAAFRDASEILGLPTPQLLVRNGMPSAFAPAPALVPAMIVALDVAESLPPDVIPFLVAKRMAELRPELAAHAFFPTVGELKEILALGARIAAAHEAKSSVAPSAAPVFLAMSSEERDQLVTAVQRLARVTHPIDLRQWLGYADVSATRAGLLLAGSVDVAARGLAREAHAPNALPTAERKRELLMFAVSDAYHDLRGAIGVAVEV